VQLARKIPIYINILRNLKNRDIPTHCFEKRNLTAFFLPR
jgi:hypothetical protein